MNKWKTVKLGDSKYFKRYGGGTPKKSKSEYWNNGNVLWLSNSELQDDKINYVKDTKNRISELGLKESSACIIPKNSVLLTCTASIGKVAINDVELATNQQFNSFECSKEVIPKYLGYYFLFIKDKLLSLAGKTSFLHITTTALNKFEIPLPHLPVQKRIVSILEKAEKLKQKREETNKETQKIIQSIFYEMFGDPVKNEKGFEIKTLNELCDVRDGTHNSPKYVSKGYPLVTSKNVKEGYIDFSDTKLISKEDFESINKRSYVDNGDIIMPMIGTIGNPIIVKKERDFAIKNVALMKFTKTDVSNIFIQALLSGSYFEYITRNAKRGGTQKFIALKDIRNIKVPIPPLPLQEEFAKRIQLIESIQSKQQQSTKEINTLFDALMQKAFKEELVE